MPNGDTQRYVIKTDTKTYRILAPKGLEQDKVLSMAAAINPEFAEVHAQHLAQKSLPQPERMKQPIPSSLFPSADPKQLKPEMEKAAAYGKEEMKKSLPRQALDIGLLFAGGTGVGAAYKALPSVISAGAKFEATAAAMKAVPVAVPKAMAAAQKAADVIEHGGISSKLISDFVEKTTGKTALTWDSARKFLSNAKSRSWLADAFSGQTGAARHAIGEFIESLGTEIMDAAESAGHGEAYASALKEYRNAMVLARVLKGVAMVGGAYALDKLTGSHVTGKIRAITGAIAD